MALNAPPPPGTNPMVALIQQFASTVNKANDAIKRRVERLEQQDITNTALGHTNVTFSNLPATLSPGLEYFCTNCRKAGEPPAGGTGLNVYQDTTGAWLNVFNNSAAAA